MADFVPTFWNALTQHNGSSRVSKIFGGQVAYKKQGYAWAPVNNNIKEDFSATEFPGNVDFPSTAHDWVELTFDGEYSAKRQIKEKNWHNSEDPLEMRVRTETPSNSIGIINPDKPWQVVYHDAFGKGANLIYGIWKGRTARFEHVIEIAEMPPGDEEYLKYDFFVQSNDAMAFAGPDHDQRPWAGNSGDGATVHGVSVFLAKGNDPATPRGAVLRPPKCWWTNLDGSMTVKDVRVDVEIQPDGITVKCTKWVKRSDAAEALSQGSVYRADATFNPDASPETSSVDGYVLSGGGDVNWATKIAASGSSASDTAVELLHTLSTRAAGIYRNFYRPFVGFDTSSIGAGQSVDSASLTLTYIGTGGPGTGWDSELINVYESNQASDTAVATGDCLLWNSTALATGVTYGTIKALSAEATQAFTFNSSGRDAIDMTGNSNFVSLWENDADATSPPSPSIFSGYGPKWRSAETSLTNKDPLLTVTHSAESSGSPHYYYSNQQGAV